MTQLMKSVFGDLGGIVQNYVHLEFNLENGSATVEPNSKNAVKTRKILEDAT